MQPGGCNRRRIRINADTARLLTMALKFNVACDQREQRVIAAHANIDSWVKLCTALADQNAARLYKFAAMLFDA